MEQLVIDNYGTLSEMEHIWEIYGRYMGFMDVYPLVIWYVAIENGPVEIVDSPIENGDFR